MNPVLPATAMAVFVILAARGLLLLRPEIVPERWALEAEDSSRRRPQTSFVARFFTFCSERLANPAMRALGGKRLDAIRRRLEVAGRPMTVESYAGRKATFAILFGAVGLLFLRSGSIVGFLLMTGAGLFWIDLWLLVASQRRQAQLNRDLPDFLDVLAVTVSAGLNFRAALGRVSQSLGGPLASEIEVCLHQMDLGFPRREAMEALRGRNDSEALNQFVTALLQAEELGAPLADTLVNLAVDMRRSASQEARRRAARTVPRISLVVTLVMVPGAMILITVGLYLSSGANVGDLTGG